MRSAPTLCIENNIFNGEIKMVTQRLLNLKNMRTVTSKIIYALSATRDWLMDILIVVCRYELRGETLIDVCSVAKIIFFS